MDSEGRAGMKASDLLYLPHFGRRLTHLLFSFILLLCVLKWENEMVEDGQTVKNKARKDEAREEEMKNNVKSLILLNSWKEKKRIKVKRTETVENLLHSHFPSALTFPFCLLSSTNPASRLACLKDGDQDSELTLRVRKMRVVCVERRKSFSDTHSLNPSIPFLSCSVWMKCTVYEIEKEK